MVKTRTRKGEVTEIPEVEHVDTEINDVQTVFSKLRSKNKTMTANNGYIKLLHMSLVGMTMSEFKSFVNVFYKTYRRDHPEPDISSWDELDLNALCSDNFGIIDDFVMTIEGIPHFIRFVFAKCVVTNRWFGIRNVKVFEGRFKSKFYSNSHAMHKLVNRIRQNIDDLQESSTVLCNVIYSRIEGLNIFVVDQQDLMSPQTVRVALILMVDKLPTIFLRLLNGMCESILIAALKGAFATTLKEIPIEEKVSLRDAIIGQSLKYNLTRENFPIHIQKLLKFDSHTLMHVDRSEDLSKYPSIMGRPFNKVSIDIQPGLSVTFKAKKGENLVETFYKLESQERLCIPKHVIEGLAQREKNKFTLFDSLKS